MSIYTSRRAVHAHAAQSGQGAVLISELWQICVNCWSRSCVTTELTFAYSLFHCPGVMMSFSRRYCYEASQKDLFGFDFSVAEFSATLQIPVLSDFLRSREAFFFSGDPPILAREVG